MASTAFARERIDLDHPATWPKAVCAFLAEHHELFLRWETTQGGVSPQMFDGAIVVCPIRKSRIEHLWTSIWIVITFSSI